MAIPVPIPVGALAITDVETTKAEELVAALIQIVQSGTSGGTPAIRTPALILPPGINPPIDPGTGQPLLTTLAIDSPQAQLLYRQLVVAMVKTVPLWVREVFNETPTGLVNGVNTIYTTTNNYRSGSTRVYLNGLRQKPGTHYTESAVNQVTFVTPPPGAALILIDYGK